MFSDPFADFEYFSLEQTLPNDSDNPVSYYHNSLDQRPVISIKTTYFCDCGYHHLCSCNGDKTKICIHATGSKRCECLDLCGKQGCYCTPLYKQKEESFEIQLINGVELVVEVETVQPYNKILNCDYQGCNNSAIFTDGEYNCCKLHENPEIPVPLECKFIKLNCGFNKINNNNVQKKYFMNRDHGVLCTLCMLRFRCDPNSSIPTIPSPKPTPTPTTPSRVPTPIPIPTPTPNTNSIYSYLYEQKITP
jgi:hypothetical protein